MGSPQLYYTSCEHGLSGFSGYQFNAATPGVDARVLREVERFTVYEPPRSLPPDQVHRHPVNLCYSPDLGGVRVLSRVVSSGDDPSGRPGNYFAHSLLLDGAAGPLPAELWGAPFWTGRPVSEPDLPGLAPAPGPLDRGRTSAWLRGRDEATLRRLLMAVDAAIDDGPPVLLLAEDEDAAHWVAALSHLLPPRRALGMSFATYSGSPEDAPVHVVAVPPETDTRALRTSFVVFGARCLDRLPVDESGWTRANGVGRGPSRTIPEPGGAHVDGTGADGTHVGGVDPDGTHADGTDASLVWAESDPSRTRSTSDAWKTGETAPDTLAVVAALVRAGVERAPALWAEAGPYASGREGSLAQWRPPLAAASVTAASVTADPMTTASVAGHATSDATSSHHFAPTDHTTSTASPAPGHITSATDSDLRALRHWLPDAVAWLPPGRCRALLDRVLALAPDSPRDDELARLQRVAHACGSPTLTERVEGLIVRRVLERIATGSPAPAMAPTRSSATSAAAGERVGALLEGRLVASVPEPALEPERAVELLRWARNGGVPLPEASMRRYGTDFLAHRLAERPPWADPDPHLAALITDHAPIRHGAARGLSALPRHFLADSAAGPLGALFTLDRDPSTAMLRELRLLHPRERRQGDPLPLLRGVVSLRGRARTRTPPGLPEHDLDRELLLRVWGTTPAAEAVVLSLGVIDQGTLVAPDVGPWCVSVLSRPPSPEQEGWWRRALSSPAYRALPLPPQGKGLLRDWLRVKVQVEALERARGDERPRALAALTDRVRGCGPVVVEIVRRRIGVRLSRWDESLSARILASCEPEVFDAYLRATAARLLPPPDGAPCGPVGLGEADLVARVFLTARRLGGATRTPGPAAERGRALLVNVLEPAALTWSRRDTAAVRKSFGHPEEEHAFDRWARRVRERAGRGGLFGRLWRGRCSWRGRR